MSAALSFFEFVTDLKYFIGIRQGKLPGIGQFQAPSGTPEEIDPQFFFQL